MADAFEHWLPQRITAATQCPESAIRQHWPTVHAALDRLGIAGRPVQVAAIGTIAIETASRFAPIHEFRNADGSIPAIWHTYDGGPEFHGRGFIQITHRSNYRRYGDMLGIDLVANPDRALEPTIAADILALYFANHGGGPLIPEAARRGDWREVRRLVQGGSAGLDRFTQIVTALGGAAMPPLPFNPDAPVDTQEDQWSCSIQATQWLLRSIGRNPDANDPAGDPWLKGQLVPALVTPALGLLDGSGRQLAAWITREYGAEMGFVAHAADVTFDDVLAGAGVNPTLIGGHRWGPGGHWAGVRRADDQGRLELANPSPNYTGVGTHLDRAEWDARAPWSAIWIDRAAALPDPPLPPLPPLAPKPTLEEVRAELRKLTAISDDQASGRYLRAELAALVERIR